IRKNTVVPYELIVVDNGSAPEAAAYAAEVADIAILNPSNAGFAAGMNQGLGRASGQNVAFVNNDTKVPPGWAGRLLSNFSTPNVGLVVPAVTAAGNPVTVRTTPGHRVITLPPFGELPSGVVYVMRANLIRELGGWNETYPVASAEDLDLIFTVWTNDLDIVLDERVLVEHVSRGTVKVKLPDREQLYRDNLNRFLDRWTGNDEIVRIADCAPTAHAHNRKAGRAAALWLQRLIDERATSRQLRSELAELTLAKKGRFRR
ncbi:MAG: glycosyltransferase, partial [Acidimicrobiia bacterium]|nr:glycosyltransferase [Acidimicrobiia bacterium]